MTDDLDIQRQSRSAMLAEIEAAGSRIVRERVCQCPHPDHADNNPSAGIRQGRDGVWRVRCFSCGFHGDIFDIRAAVTGRALADVLRDARGGAAPPPRSERTKAPPVPPVEEQPTTDVATIARNAVRAITDEQLSGLAGSLGLSTDSLRRLWCGWSAHHQAWTFPMYDAFGKVRGVRLRGTDGRKWSVRGGKEGLFVPDGLCGSDTLAICEGPTDCAALLDMGVEAVGRPSNQGGTRYLRWIAAIKRPRRIIIVHDRDEPGSPAEQATRSAAERLAAMVGAANRTVCVITPPEGIKDVRAWRIAGATIDDLHAQIDSSRERRARPYAWLKRVREIAHAN